MTYVRRLVKVSAMLLAMLGVAAAPAVAGFAHPRCAAQQDECGRTSATVSCPCCGDQSGSSTKSGAPPTPVQPVCAAVAWAGPIAAVVATTPVHTGLRALMTPRAGPVDLPTLFACLLI